MSRQGAWEDERGFTLVEVMIVIILMGIVFAIASSSWFGAAESRRVDSATNQLAADLRLAHTRRPTGWLSRFELHCTIRGQLRRTRYGPADSLETRTLPATLEDDTARRESSLACASYYHSVQCRRREHRSRAGTVTATSHARWRPVRPIPYDQVNTATSRVQIDFRKRLKEEPGYSLVEVMVSIMILCHRHPPDGRHVRHGPQLATRSSNYDKARALANLKMEEAKSLPFDRRSRTNFPEAVGRRTPTTRDTSPGLPNSMTEPASADLRRTSSTRSTKQYMAEAAQERLPHVS